MPKITKLAVNLQYHISEESLNHNEHNIMLKSNPMKHLNTSSQLPQLTHITNNQPTEHP